MKKLISLFLSAVMVASMCVGLDFSALAKDVTKVEFTGVAPVTFYEGSNCYETGENDDENNWVNFTRYNVNAYYAINRGDKLTVTYDDNSEKVFTCKEVYFEDEGYYTDALEAPDGEVITFDDIDVDDNQGWNKQWTVGNSYTFYLVYKNQKAAATARIVQNPVKSIDVETTGKITLFENCVGDYDNEDNFNYWGGQDNYLRKLNPVIHVTYADDSTTDFYYVKENWIPVDKDGNEIVKDQFGLDFNEQYNNHFVVGGNYNATVYYYGREDTVPVEVVAKHDVDEGVIALDETKSVLMYDDEWHSFTFTPDETGVYPFEEGLAYRTRNEDEFECTVTESGNKVDALTNDENEILYLLEKDKEYTISFRRNESRPDQSTQFEFFRIIGPEVAATELKFYPAGGAINVYEGEYGGNYLVNNEGDVIEVTFSNGETKRFVCDKEGDYVNEENRDEAIWDYCRSIGFDTDTTVYATPNYEPWESGKESFVTVRFANVSCRQNVNVVVSPIKNITYTTAEPFKVYEGTAQKRNEPDEHNHWVDYDYYDIDSNDFCKDGNTFTVTYNDDTTETFAFDDDEYVYVSNNGTKISPDELHIVNGQSLENQWSVGNTYQIQITYKGKAAAVNVTVEPSPIKDLTVEYDKPITVFRNCNGNESYDGDTDSNFFLYRSDRDYLRKQNPTINVTFNDNSVKSYTFKDFNWVPTDENGEELDNKAFDFRFDQWGSEEKHEHPVGIVSYYNKEATVPVNVIDKKDIEEGELEVNGEEPTILFLSDENHIFTLNPESDGIFTFCGGFEDGVERGEFDFSVQENGVDVEREDDDKLSYSLKAGKTYAVIVKHNEDYSIRFEGIGVQQRLGVKDLVFTPVKALSATEGERYDERLFYTEGNKLTITLTDGRTSTFTAIDGGYRYVNSNNEDINYFLGGLDMDDGYLQVDPSADIWTYGEEAYIKIKVGNKETRYPVEIKQSAVTSISFVPQKPVEVNTDLIWYYEMDGRWISEIVDIVIKKGDVLNVTYSDERGTVKYICTGEDTFTNENNENDVIHTRLFYDEDKHYVIGDTVDFLLSFEKATTPFTGTVVENPVTEAVYTPAVPFEFLECEDGEWWRREHYDEETQQMVRDDFFCYGEKDIFAAGSTFAVTYRADGRTVVYTSDGEKFVSADGDELNSEQVGALWGRDQYEHPFTVGGNNIIKVHYMNYETSVPVTINSDGWTLYANAVVNNSKEYKNNETITIDPGQTIFVHFKTHERNMKHQVAPFVGFPYDELREAGFTVTDGLAKDLGFSGYDEYTYGLKIQAPNVKVGTKVALPFNVYELDENFSWDNFDWVNTRIVLSQKVNIQVVDHKWNAGAVTKKATYTATGVKTYTCMVCGQKKTSQIAKLAKKKNTLTAKNKTLTVKTKDVAKKAKTYKAASLFAVKKAKGKVTYSVVSGKNKNVTVASNGKITVKKKAKKGTYKMKIRIKAAGNTEYNALNKDVTFKVVIK